MREREEKGKQKKYHEESVKTRTFSMGDFVLVFRPTQHDKLSNQWQGPFPITKEVTPVTYQVDLGARVKRYRTFHVNCVRAWKSPSVINC